MKQTGVNQANPGAPSTGERERRVDLAVVVPIKRVQTGANSGTTTARSTDVLAALRSSHAVESGLIGVSPRSSDLSTKTRGTTRHQDRRCGARAGDGRSAA